MRFSESIGRKIVSLATAETIGTLGEFVVDPKTQRVVALGVSKSKNGDTLPWNGIESHEARRQFADPVAGVFPVVCIHVQPFSAAIIHFQCIHRKRGLL